LKRGCRREGVLGRGERRIVTVDWRRELVVVDVGETDVYMFAAEKGFMKG
jgi:hypothetical protein